jgi:hypothetical protein
MWVFCECDRCGTVYWKICALLHYLFFVNFNEFLKRQPFGLLVWVIHYYVLNMSCFFPHLCNTPNKLIDKCLPKLLRWVFQMHISTYIQKPLCSAWDDIYPQACKFCVKVFTKSVMISPGKYNDKYSYLF